MRLRKESSGNTAGKRLLNTAHLLQNEAKLIIEEPKVSLSDSFYPTQAPPAGTSGIGKLFPQQHL